MYTEEMCCDTLAHVPAFALSGAANRARVREKTSSYKVKDGQRAYRSTRTLCTVTKRLWE